MLKCQENNHVYFNSMNKIYFNLLLFNFFLFSWFQTVNEVECKHEIVFNYVFWDNSISSTKLLQFIKYCSSPTKSKIFDLVVLKYLFQKCENHLTMLVMPWSRSVTRPYLCVLCVPFLVQALMTYIIIFYFLNFEIKR